MIKLCSCEVLNHTRATSKIEDCKVHGFENAWDEARAWLEEHKKNGWSGYDLHSLVKLIERRAERVLEAPPRESRTFDELLLAFDREEALSANEVRRLWDEGYFEYSAKGFQRLTAIGER